MVTLMISGALATKQNRIVTVVTVAIVIVGAVLLWASRFYPTPFLMVVSAVFSTIILLLYVRIVLLVMFRQGPVTWSRIQGGICAYLLLGMAWASAFNVVEQLHPALSTSSPSP